MKWRLAAALVFGFLLALILRVPDLDQRPFHNDEAVNAIKFRELFQDGTYRYDPHEHHGPSLHYGTLALARLTGWKSFAATTEADFRWLSVLASLALVPLLWLTRDGVGRSGTQWAVLLTALSPSLTFFARDYIHESLLVASTFLFIGCLWRYWRHPGWKWAAAAGLALALMHATKETFVLNLAALGISGGALMLWGRYETSETAPLRRGKFRHLWVLVAVWFGVAALLFSSFGTNPTGVADSVRTYLPWLSRAGGQSEHIHPFWFYGQRLFWQPSGFPVPWTEFGLLILALIGGGSAFLRKGLGDAVAGFVRWLTLYTVTLFIIYSVIPYKTPWCILGVSHGLTLLAGVGLAVLWRQAWKVRQRVVMAVVTLLLVGQLGWQSWMLSHASVPARRNPWSYAETSPDIRNFVQRLEALAAVDPQGRDLPVQVVCEEDDYWPLPYYLRNYPRVGWWSKLPPEPRAPVLLVSPGMGSQAELEGGYVATGSFQLRPGVFRSCLVERELWEGFLRTRESGSLRR